MMRTRRIKGVLFAFAAALALVCGTADVYAAGIASPNQAREKALKKVPGADVVDVERDDDGGAVVYEVELVKGNTEYTLEYRASDAKLISYEWEKKNVDVAKTKPLISMEKCKSLAGKKVKGGTMISCVKDKDDGVDVFEVKMKSGKKKYHLKYHARKGTLIEYGWEYRS